MARQDSASAALNAEFFAGDQYARDIELDTFVQIGAALNRELAGIERLLDVGNGGVFEYDTRLAREIVAVDLFLDRLPASHFPANVTPRTGDALALTELEGAYDAVLHALIYHHLVGADPDEMIANVRRAIAEAHRVLEPGGRLIVAESCVPVWFYAIERVLFKPLAKLATTPLLGGHPAVIQLPFARVVELVGERFEIVSAYEVPIGRWTTQFGVRWPTALTPARGHIVVGRRGA